MGSFTFQFRREQRVDFVVEADTEAEALRLAEEQANDFDLLSADDCSDDKGELELMETHEEDEPPPESPPTEHEPRPS